MELRIPRGRPDALDRVSAVVNVNQFHHLSTDHRPFTVTKIAYDHRTIYLRFDVNDRYVSCQRIGYQAEAWKDSCVEFFVQPKPESGYFNFEINCGGNLLLRYNPPGQSGTHRDFIAVSAELAKGVVVKSSLVGPYASQGDEPVNWWVTLSIPIDFMQNFVGPIQDLRGQTWTGNFYKCGDYTPKPHWASWAPVGQTLNFHQPSKFGRLIFD